MIEPILAGELLPPDALDDDVRLVRDLGLIAEGPVGLGIANPIYLCSRCGCATCSTPSAWSPFGDAQRRVTIRAGELAGLEVVRILNEPTAAALG